MMLFFRFVVELLKVQMPPPLIEPLPEKVLLVTFRIAALLMPPPVPAVGEPLPEKVLLVTFTVPPFWFEMPPPVPLLAELLPEKVLLVTFTVPAFWPKGPLKMPPPEYLEQAGKLLAGVNAQTPSFHAFRMKMNQLLLERQFDEAIRLIHNRLTEFRDLSDLERLVNPFFLAFAQEYASDTVGARATAQQTVGPLETLCQKDPDNPNFAQALSLTRAVLGQKDAAIKEAERAITLLPSDKDAVDGPRGEEILASVEVLVGDKDRAIPRLQHLLEIPYANCLTPALLRLHPAWDPLRGDPAFQKLCEEKQP